MLEKKIGPPTRKQGASQNRKKVLFCIKNVKNFEFGIHIFFLKNFSTHQCAERALCTKMHFSNGTIVNKKKAKNPKISKILLSYCSKKIIEKIKIKKIYFFSAPAAPRHFIFFRRLQRLFFFFFCKGKMKMR